MGIYTFIWIVNFFWLLPFQEVICQENFAPVVELPLGKAVGRVSIGAYQYLGIPYAETPTGSKRFEPPVAYSRPWLGERFFTKNRNDCIGLNNYYRKKGTKGPTTKYEVTGSEDCLYLNVYRRAELTTPVPVIFFIHGGFFSFSDRERYGPDYLMAQNVVYVNFDYRVGPFGFMSSGTEALSGNMGLKDIILALNWVKVNIWKFGGNTNKITVAGIDAGAASAHLLYYSRISDELFNNAISYSGTAFSPWAFSKMTTVVGQTRALAEQLKCLTFPAGEMLRCMQSKSAEEIMNILSQWKTFYYYPYARFTPVDDSKFQHGVFVNDPLVMANEKKGKLNDWMTGYTIHNALYHIIEFAPGWRLLKVFTDRWSDILPDLLFYNKNCKTIAKVATQGYAAYISTRLLDLVTDRNYRQPQLFSVELMSQRSAGKTFAYIFDHQPEKSVAQALPQPTNRTWDRNYFSGQASLGDDVANVFFVSTGGPDGVTPGEAAVQKTLMDITMSFCSTGLPPSSIVWDEFDIAYPRYYNIVHQHAYRDVDATAGRPPHLEQFDNTLASPNCKL